MHRNEAPSMRPAPNQKSMTHSESKSCRERARARTTAFWIDALEGSISKTKCASTAATPEFKVGQGRSSIRIKRSGPQTAKETASTGPNPPPAAARSSGRSPPSGRLASPQGDRRGIDTLSTAPLHSPTRPRHTGQVADRRWGVPSVKINSLCDENGFVGPKIPMVMPFEVT